MTRQNMAAQFGENMMISVVLIGFACVIIGTETVYSIIVLIFVPRNWSLSAPKTAASLRYALVFASDNDLFHRAENQPNAEYPVSIP